MVRRRTKIAIAVATSVTAMAGIAYALVCTRATQHATLEVVAVTIDGVPQTDVSAFTRLRVTVAGNPNNGGVQLTARTSDDPQGPYHVEAFDVSSTRDH